jgi:hypothetical protein
LVNPVARRVIHPLGTFQISFQTAQAKDKNYNNVNVLPPLSPNNFGWLCTLSHLNTMGRKIEENTAESIDRER